MIKTYKSSSEIHISVNLPSGARRRVSFNPITGGGSMLTTKDADIQAGLESHPFFGKLYILAAAKDDEKPAVKTAGPKKEEQKGQKQVNVSSLDDAKEFLVDNFGMSRTKLRSKAQILAAAEANGIEFVGI